MSESNDFAVNVQANFNQTPIDKAATDHANSLADLEGDLQTLFEKIGPILGPDIMVKDLGASDQDSPEMSRLQRYFVEETDHVRRIAGMVRAVRNRVEC